MSEKYISASKLKAHYSWLGKDATLSPKDIDDIIDAQPAADVEPVVRGEWMWKTTKEAEAFAPLGIVLGTENYICSECKKYLHRESMRNHLPIYCDECGAKMGLPGKERER